MRLKDIITAIREYPRTKAELEELRDRATSEQLRCEQLESRCEEMNSAGLEQECELKHLQKTVKSLQAILDTFPPQLDSAEMLRKAYDCVAPFRDPEGFGLYRAAQEITGIKKLYNEFPYEDARGYFEFMDGHAMLRYLTAAHFGAVDWSIVDGTTYEAATLLEVDQATPEYQTFQKKLYTKALQNTGFGKIISVPPVAQQMNDPMAIVQEEQYQSENTPTEQAVPESGCMKGMAL